MNFLDDDVIIVTIYINRTRTVQLCIIFSTSNFSWLADDKQHRSEK